MIINNFLELEQTNFGLLLFPYPFQFLTSYTTVAFSFDLIFYGVIVEEISVNITQRFS